MPPLGVAAGPGPWRNPRRLPRRVSGDRGALGRAAFGAALLAHTAQDAAPAVLFQARIEGADLGEDLVGDRLLLLARRLLDPLPADRLTVLDRHLGELQALPVADVRAAVDRDRHDRRTRLERQAPDAALGLAAHP